MKNNNNQILGIYTDIATINSTPKNNKTKFTYNTECILTQKYDKTTKQASYRILTTIDILCINVINNDLGYSYLKDDDNIYINGYSFNGFLSYNISSYHSSDIIHNEQQAKDLYLKYNNNFKEFLEKIFENTGIGINDYNDYYSKIKKSREKGDKNPIKFNDNFYIFNSLLNSPYLNKLLGLDNKKTLVDLLKTLENNKIVKDYDLYDNINLSMDFNFSTLQSQLNYNELYAKEFKETTNFLHLPYEFRIKETGDYIDNITSKGLIYSKTREKLYSESKKIRLEHIVKINNTLDQHTIEHKENNGNFKQIIYSQPKPCKNFVEKLKQLDTVENIIEPPKETKEYQLFKAILENITCDSNGEFSPLYFNFILAQLSRFINNPTKPLKISERGFVMFEGGQEGGKSTFIKLLKLLFEKNTLALKNSQIKDLSTSSMNTLIDDFQFATFIVMEESLEFTLKMKELLKEFIFEDTLTIPQKYKTTTKIDVNYTLFCSYNKDKNAVRGDIFLEHGSTNRRFVFCTCKGKLLPHLESKGFTYKDIEVLMNSPKKLLRILNGLKFENQEYNFNILDSLDEDKKLRVKNAVATTEGLLLEKLEELNQNPMDFITSYNIPQNIINYNKLFTDQEYIYIPLTVFNEYCWKSRTPKVSRRKVKDTIQPLLDDNNLRNIKLSNTNNIVKIIVKNNNIRKCDNNIDFINEL